MEKLIKSVEETRKEVPADVTGNIPSWLNGSLVRIGPGKWDLPGGFTLNHWLDGCAILSKLKIEDSKVSFSSKYVESDAYKKMMKHGKPVFTEFGTKAHADPSKGIFSRIVNSIVPSDLTDNDISNIYAIQNEVYVATESCNIWQVDPATLESKNKVNLDKTAGVNICGSHPHYSDSDGTTYNLGASFMTGLKYHVMKVPAMPEKSELIDVNGEPKAYKKASILATIPSSYTASFSYSHSFAMTERYIIFLEQPLLVNGIKLATCTPKGKPLQECLEWCGDEPTRFHVIEKATGNQLKIKYQSEAFYHFHNINAYEDENHIVLDVIAYDDASVLEKYELKRMRRGEWDNSCPPMARRYVLPLGDLESFKVSENLVKLSYTTAKAIKVEKTDKGVKGVIRMTPEQLAPPGFELPRINYKRFNGKKYRYIFGSGVFEMGYYAHAICKVDLITKKIDLWRESETAYPGEAVFIPKPGGTDEDDGVVMSLVLESDESKSHYLLVVDAKNMKEIARATFPVRGVQIPTTIHGIFVPQ